MEINIILKIIWLHFISDFLLQSDWMAVNKSNNSFALGIHGFIYGIPFLIIDPIYSILNMLLHFLIDGISSQLTTHFYKNEQRHWFFVTIGADQAIHFTILILTYKLFVLS